MILMVPAAGLSSRLVKGWERVVPARARRRVTREENRIVESWVRCWERGEEKCILGETGVVVVFCLKEGSIRLTVEPAGLWGY